MGLNNKKSQTQLRKERRMAQALRRKMRTARMEEMEKLDMQIKEDYERKEIVREVAEEVEVA